MNGSCAFGGDCRKSVVVYKAECIDCGMCYLGNTQQKLKMQTRQHLGEVCKLVNTGKASDSFAKHFAIHQKQRTTKLTIREDSAPKVKVSILWQGDPPNLLQEVIRKIELLSMYERESSHSQTFERKSTRHHQQQ